MGLLLIGAPNVGKSVIFNRLTGLDVGIANYPGTTVDFKKGQGNLEGRTYELIDAPGTYSLDAANEAEKVAVKMLSMDPEGVICVLDALNLESSIYLLQQVMERQLPTIAVINRMDLIEGNIDTVYLEEELGIPVMTTVAIKGEGMDELKKKMKKLLDGEISPPEERRKARWEEAERINDQAKTSGKKSGGGWGDLLIKPFPGIPLALVIMGAMFLFVVGVGLGLRRFVLMPIFEQVVFPPITAGVEHLTSEGVLRNVLVGEYGFLIKSIEWPLGLVLPYIISFYTALSILEDSGYMPRLAVLIDGTFKKMGLSGSHIIPFLLGYGCAIPAIMSTRNFGTRKERIMISAMVSLSVPCVAQSGAFIALLAEHSLILVLVLFVFSMIAAFVSGWVIGKIIKVRRMPMIQEVPEMLIPDWKMLGKKLWIRVKHFLKDGVVPMIVIIGVAAILYETGVLVRIGEWMEPLVTGWLGLPKDATTPLILGVFRRELAVLPLLDMELSTLQLFVASVIALFYVPCIAVLGVLAKELGMKVSAGVLVMTMVISFLLGGIIAQIGMLL